jgi:AmmeMemoRadiSam system protein B/AmmeMemoRadiSam system protein A
MSPVLTYHWMAGVRQAAVAGMFYPADAGELRAMVREMLRAAPAGASAAGEGWAKALIAPHAGYIYSGPVAGSAYRQIEAARGHVRRVVLIGPAHRVAVEGLAVSGARAFATPLGEVPVDESAVERVLQLPFVHVLDQAHAREHSLEVHLPFLQEVLGDFALVPLVFGAATAEQVAQALELLWGGEETLIVVSSDLSHYHEYNQARALDGQTARAIETLRPDSIAPEQACGRTAIQGLLQAAARHGLRVHTLDLRNSGDTAGPRDQVVGYGAWSLTAPGATPGEVSTEAPAAAGHLPAIPAGLDAGARAVLLRVAADSIVYGLEHHVGLPVDPAGYAPALRPPRATFVTLHLDGALRGCIGTLQAMRPLVADVSANAYAAAFTDPRFLPVTAEQAPHLDIHISILSAPEPVHFTSPADLLRQLRPGVDGLILEEPGPATGWGGPRGRRGTFLPAVWESLPEPADFLLHLKLKAGLPADYWSDTLRLWRYTAESVSA